LAQLSDGCVFSADATVEAAQIWMKSKHHVQPSKLPRKIIVLNWGAEQESLVDAFAEFSPAGTEVVFVGEHSHSIPARVRNVKFREVRCAAQSRVYCSVSNDAHV
jgi:hypothetical protein